MNKLFILSFTALLFFSCQKETVQPQPQQAVDMSGKHLIIKALDPNRQPIPEALVFVTQIYGDYTSYVEVFQDTTDVNGVCNVGKLAEGNYHVEVRKGFNSDYRFFQMVYGVDRTEEFFPFGK